jgi:predicted nucleotidyltransferase
MNDHINIVRIKAVYDALEELADDFIFVGGAVASLYVERPSGEIRPTDDVDILIELLDYKGYAAIEEKLRNKGFENDTTSGIICRYVVSGIIVDVMPTSEKILGFANRWYAGGIAHAVQVSIGDGYSIRIFSAPYFLATKLEAFNNRGGGDGRTSSDFEDIVYLLNNRPGIWGEILGASNELSEWLTNAFTAVMNEPYLDEWISCHLEYREQRRVGVIMGSMADFIST